MTRNIRKIVSIICAVAILMSLCVVSVVNTTSALQLMNAATDGVNKTGAEPDNEDTINERYVFNFKNDENGTFWAPNSHAHFSNSNGNGSFVDEEGVHFKSTNKLDLFGKATWRHKVFLYDEDNGGYMQIKEGASYIVTVKYKLVEINSGKVWIGVGHTGGNNNATKNPASSAGGQEIGGITDDSFAQHTATTDEWQYLNVQFDATGRENTWLAIIAHANSSAENFWLIESVIVKEFKSSAGASVVSFETNGGDAIESNFYAVGTPISEIPAPTNSDPDKGFSGWYLDSAFTTPAPETLPAGNITLYAKWISEYVKIKFNNVGIISTARIAPGTTLSAPERPSPMTFFEGWYTDYLYTQKVTVAPDQDCELYAKYNYNYVGFNIGGRSDASYNKIGIVADPDDENNKALELHTVRGASHNFELGAYDAAGVGAYEMLKPNTTYYIEFKIKVLPGNKGGNVTVYTGGQSAYSGDASKAAVGGLDYSWSDEIGEVGTDWITVSGNYTVGENFYRERVNFTVQDQLYWVYSGRANGEGTNSAAGVVLIDDVIVGEFSDVPPEGAVAIYFKTNSTNMNPIFGYPGDAVFKPQNPTLASHEFVGWYTDKNFLHEFDFENGCFGTENITLYAKWMAAPQEYDLERFNVMSTTSDRFNYVNVPNGNSYLRYNYEQGTSDASASSIARAIINDVGIRYNVVPGATYTMSFKYKVEETTGNIEIKPVTHNSGSTWGDSKEQGGTFTISSATSGWEEGSCTFVASCQNSYSTYLSIGVGGDATVLIDDIKVECAVNFSNIYGSTVISFDTLGGPGVDPVSGNPGEEIWLPTPNRAGFKFGGWFTDGSLTAKFTEKIYGEEAITLYASWILGKMSESYEDFPVAAEFGISSAYQLYKKDNPEVTFSKDNVHAGSVSIFRDGTATGDKGFTLCRDTALTLGVGQQYTVSFWVKPTNVTDNAGLINLLQMSSNTSVGAPDATETITEVGNLKVGEWQKVTYTFTASEQYIGISTTQGNDIYFDNITVNLKGYTGTTTGDNTVNPIIIMMMVVLAAGAMVVTAKRVFAK